MFRCASFLTFVFYLTLADSYGSHQHGQHASGTTPQEFLNPFDPQNTFREVSGNIDKLELVFAWKSITYNLNGYTLPESPAPGNASSVYVPYSNVPFGVDRWKDKLFITIPRFGQGIPATVNWLSLSQDTNTKSPGLRPYPDLQTNTVIGRTGQEQDHPLVFVFRPKVDKCDRLWLADVGLNVNVQLQRPALSIYDLNTDTRILRHIFEDSVLKNGFTRGFVSLTVDTEDGDCSKAFAYIPHFLEPGLIIYSLEQNRSWRMIHNYFYPDPMRGDYHVNGLNFNFNDGVFSLVLTKLFKGRSTTFALFHPLNGYNEFSVSTEVLKNETLATRNYHFDDVKILGSRGPLSQSTIHGIHVPTGVVFYAQISTNSITCWNSRKPLKPENIATMAQDNELLYYPCDLRVDNDDGDVWLLTNKLPEYFYSKLDANKVNFRVYRMKPRSAIVGTVCEI